MTKGGGVGFGAGVAAGFGLFTSGAVTQPLSKPAAIKADDKTRRRLNFIG